MEAAIPHIPTFLVSIDNSICAPQTLTTHMHMQRQESCHSHRRSAEVCFLLDYTVVGREKCLPREKLYTVLTEPAFTSQIRRKFNCQREEEELTKGMSIRHIFLQEQGLIVKDDEDKSEKYEFDAHEHARKVLNGENS